MLKAVTSPSPTLDPDAASGLVALRLMLQDAVNRVHTSHRFSRGAAIVALDATVERVSYLVALRRGLDLSPKATLADIYSKLVASFDTTWKPTACRRFVTCTSPATEPSTRAWSQTVTTFPVGSRPRKHT